MLRWGKQSPTPDGPAPAGCGGVHPPGNEAARQALTNLGPHYLPVRTGERAGATVPDANGPGRRTRLAAALRGHGAVIGANVPLDQLPASADLAELTADLARTGALSGDPVFVEDHLDAVIAHRDRASARPAARAVPGPLDGAAPASRQVLQDTLRCWLRHMGDRAVMAE